ncbi:MAG: hypothetical protein KDD51_07990 [Bdellovibrionales bacterium]|nr:hypothetical protein [Bdellovibrionales bacterium]
MTKPMRKDSINETGTVLHFRRSSGNSSSQPFVSSNSLNDAFERGVTAKEEMRGTFIGEIIDRFVQYLGSLPSNSDPFDAIYLSALRPDTLSREDVDTVKQHSGIVDLSDTITFDDGFDD